MKEGTQPVIFGDGKKSRDYIAVMDIVRANKLALNKGKNMILNLGTGKLTTDIGVFTAVARQLHFKKPPQYLPHRKGETRKISLNAGAAKKALGWKAMVTLSEGLRDMFGES
jgi:UDP-glucose 4-epimerase